MTNKTEDSNNSNETIKFKISVENATESYQSLLDYYEIDLADLPEKERIGLESVAAKLIKWIRQGRLEINLENGIQCIQTLRSGGKLIYREIDGASKTAMGTKEMTDQHGRMYAVLGTLCGEGESVIKMLKGPDLSLAECLGGLFLLV